MVCNNRGIDEFLGTSWVLITIYDGVYHNPPWSAFPSPIARQPRGCQYGTIRLQKALGEVLPAPTSLAHRYYSNCGHTEHENSAQGGCNIHRRVRYSGSL